MKKWFTINLLILVLMPIVFAATDVQISTDNVTWIDVTNNTYGGLIDEPQKIASALYLQTETHYYLRAKDDTTDWGYREFTTDGGLFNMIAITLALIALIMFFIYMSKHGIIWMREGFHLMAYIFALASMFVIAELAKSYGVADNVVSILYYLAYIFGIIFFVVVVMMLWNYTTEAINFKKRQGGDVYYNHGHKNK